MKRLLISIAILAALAGSSTGQNIERGLAGEGYVHRGKVNVQTGFSVWFVYGTPVRHTQEIYDSAVTARYILTRLKGKMRLASEIVPDTGSVQVKVTMRNGGVRFAWVCEGDLHFFESQSYSAAVTLLTNSKLQECK